MHHVGMQNYKLEINVNESLWMKLEKILSITWKTCVCLKRWNITEIKNIERCNTKTVKFSQN